jgi:acyl carrier protein
MDMVLSMSVRAAVVSAIEDVAKEHNRELGPLTDETELTNTGLDSLCLSVVVVRLEDRLGVDPFSTFEDGEFPVTVGDFVRMYENACA